MKLIIKQPIAKREWATIFCVGDKACEKGGTISNSVLEKMKFHGIIEVIDPVQLIEKHPKHKELIADSNSHHYLGIGPDEKYPAISTIYKTEFFCDRCVEIITPVHEHVFEMDHQEKIKCITNSRCPNCNSNLYGVFRYMADEKEVTARQEFLKSIGETWEKLY